MKNLYYGDNLEVLKESIKDESIDLIYLDPPFNSKRDYNLLFKSPKGHDSEVQVEAFVDSWHWGEQAEREFKEIVHQKNTDVSEMMQALRRFLGENDMMAYLVMLCTRLLELHRVLKPTGSLYLHCDPTASHYLKIVLDAVFGKENYLNEIVWCYKTRHFSKKHFGRKHDIILSYTKTSNYIFNWESVLRPLSEITIKKFKNEDEIGSYRLCGRGIKGSPIQSAKDVDPQWEITNPELVVRDYLKEGVPVEDYWEIDIINQSSHERMMHPQFLALNLWCKCTCLAAINCNNRNSDPKIIIH